MDGEASGWGRVQGSAVAARLVEYLDSVPDQHIVRLSMEGVEKLDASFASEAIVEVIKRYRRTKGICLVNLESPGIRLNIDLAAERVGVPITVWNGEEVDVIGLRPSAGNREALNYVLAHARVRAAEFADYADVSIANASTKLKQLWEQSFVMRTESAADSGGVEFLYRRMG